MDELQIKREMGLRIKSYRKKLKLTQEKFGEIIGLEWGNVSNIERGQQFPSMETLISLILKAGIEPNYLFGFLYNGDAAYSSLDFELLEALTKLSDDTKEHIKALISSL